MIQRYCAAAALLLTVGVVVVRPYFMKQRGIKAMRFGELDKKDFLIPPFALFYFYVIFAAPLHLPQVSTQQMFRSDIVSWSGVGLCCVGLTVLLWSVVSFGNSFRVGIDTRRPDRLITEGIFARSRNPIYVAFALILLGQFLIFSSWILLIYLFAGILLFHRQVSREEEFLARHYGSEYREYRARVRRYI